MRFDSTGLAGSIYNGGTWESTRYNIIPDDTGWHHVAYTFNDTGNTATLYLDGVAVGASGTVSSIAYNLGANSLIGKHGNGSANYDFNGKIDDARIYNRVLTANEVATLATDQAMTDTDTVAISISAVNDIPIVSTTGTTLGYTENGTAIVVDNALTVSLSQ